MTHEKRKFTNESSPTAAAYLKHSGWRLSPDGWRHPRLFTPWSINDAFDLQSEADDGRVGLIYEMVRGAIKEDR